MQELSYILKLRNALKEEYRHMPIFQNGSAIIVVNDKNQILLQERVDRDLWCIPGGLQELGETFEDVAIRELKEETGLTTNKEHLVLIGVVSGESRKNSYPNGDQVYNNTVLYATWNYYGTFNTDYKELVDNGHEFFVQNESKQLKFFSLEELPINLMDIDLILRFKEYMQNKDLAKKDNS